MTNIRLNERGEIEICVDTSIYDDSVIDKVLYWWASNYVITRQNKSGSTVQIILFSAPAPISVENFNQIQQKLSADFIDYKNRAIVATETRDLRNILYAKAFANSDDFVEFEFKD